MSTAAASHPAAVAAEGSTSAASPNQAAPGPSDSPATFQTAPAEPADQTMGTGSDEVLANLGAPLGAGSNTAEHGAAGPGDEPSSSSSTPLKDASASAPAPATETSPSTTAPQTATTSTATAAVPEAKSAPPASAPAGASSTSAPAASTSTSGGPTRQAASAAPRTARTSKKQKKKGPLAAFLSSIFFCFPSDDAAYDGSAKPPARANGPPRTPAAPAREKSVKKVSKESASTAGEKAAGSEPLRQITSRELMAVDTAAAAKDQEKTPKPPALTLPIPTTPLTKKRSASNIEAGGEILYPPPTPTSPPIDETAGLTSSAVVPPGSGTLIHSHHHHSQTSSHAPTPTSSPKLGATEPVPSADESFSATDSEVSGSDAGGQRYDDSHDDGGEQQHQQQQLEEEDEEDDDEDAHLLGGVGIPIGPDGNECPLLPPLAAAHKGRKCLVLDLDETLLHSSFKLIPQADYIVPVEIESQTHNVYVIKRPGVDNFLKKMGEIYEVVVFTASLSKYADPVLDMLDVHRVVSHRLFRESCYNHKGNYVKDLSQLGRPIDETIIIDNSPASYIFHPNNAVPVSTWFNDPHDSELSDLIMFLADLANVEDVRGVLDGGL